MVCNTGVSSIPTYDGEFLRFTNAGLYDGLFVMQDTKTLSLWNHISGVAMHGELAGESLEITGPLLQMTVGEGLRIDPDMAIAISDEPFGNSGPGFAASGGRGRGLGGARGAPDPDAQLMEMFEVTLGEEDTRRERMEMGLGIWSDDMTVRRFYPFDLVRQRGALIDEVGGRSLLVYYDSAASVPAAMFLDATSATLDGRSIRLDGDRTVEASQLFDSDGEALPVDRPNQVFTRWYGFSLTFPGPEIYDENE